jgi:hypothetical protein
MSKNPNLQSLSNPEDEMLAEYDFSQGVRGRHRSRKVGIDLPGVQFLTDDRGQKTAVLLDLQIHAELWQQISSQYPNATGFQFLVDPQNRSIAVFLDFKNHLSIWQTVYDRIITQLPDYTASRIVQST